MPSRGRRSHAIAAQAHAGPEEARDGRQPLRGLVWQHRAPRAASSTARLTLAAATAASCRRRRSSAWDLGGRRHVERCERVYVITRTLDSSPRAVPLCCAEEGPAAPLDNHLVDLRKKLGAASMARSCAVRALSNASGRDRRLWCFREHLGLERRLRKRAARRRRAAPRVVAGPDDLGLCGVATWLLERDRGAGLARRRTRARACGEHGLDWLWQNCVFSGTLRCALLQSEGLYSPARTKNVCCGAENGD